MRLSVPFICAYWYGYIHRYHANTIIHGREIEFDMSGEAKGSGTQLTAEYTLADALFEGKTNVSLAEQLFSLPVSKVPASL